MLCQAAGDYDNKRKDNVNPVLPCELQGTERVPLPSRVWSTEDSCGKYIIKYKSVLYYCINIKAQSVLSHQQLERWVAFPEPSFLALRN